MLDINAILAGAPAPTPLLSPDEAMAKRLSLQQLSQQAQTGQIQLEQAQQAQTDDQAARGMFQQAQQSGQRPTDNQVLATLGTQRGGALLKSWGEADKVKADIAKANADAAKATSDRAAHEQDYAGAMAQGVLDAGVTPESVTLAINKAHADGFETEAQMLRQLQQTNPAGISGMLTQLVKSSPKQQELARQSETAAAATSQAQTAAGNLVERTANDKATQAQAQATLAETTKRDAATQAYQQGELRNSNTRTAIDAARFNQQRSGALSALNPADRAIAAKLASGDFNPSQLGRFPNKEAIFAGAIELNQNWTPQTYAAKKAFTDPDSTQAKNLGTISRIVGHIGRFEQNSNDMGFAPAYASGVNVTGGQNALNDDAHAISAELEKLTSGGVGSIEQVKEWEKGLHSPSAAARQKSVDEISQLVGSQYEGMNQTYKAAVGSDLPVEKYVSPAGQAWMKQKGINVGGAAPTAAAPQSPQATPQAAPAAAAPAGTIAVTDPNGGVHYFRSAAQAQAFKSAAGIK